jgi:hypothetical protein
MQRHKITFKNYYKRVGRKVWEEGRDWGRDQFLVAFIVVLLATIVSFRLGYIKLEEGFDNIVGAAITYGIGFLAFIVYLGFRAPWLLDNDRQEEVDAAKVEEEKACKERERLEKKLHDGRPLFVLDVITAPSWGTSYPGGGTVT